MDINNVVLVGRLTKEIELKYTSSGKAYCKISLAVNRMKKDEVDFINCIAWEKTAEVIAQYCTKGERLGVVGRIQTGSYDREGVKVYTTDVIINNVQLLGTKKDGTAKVGFEVTAEGELEDDFPF